MKFFCAFRVFRGYLDDISLKAQQLHASLNKAADYTVSR